MSRDTRKTCLYCSFIYKFLSNYYKRISPGEVSLPVIAIPVLSLDVYVDALAFVFSILDIEKKKLLFVERKT